MKRSLTKKLIEHRRYIGQTGQDLSETRVAARRADEILGARRYQHLGDRRDESARAQLILAAA